MDNSEDKRQVYKFEKPDRLARYLVKLKTRDPAVYALLIKGIIFGKDLLPDAEVLPGTAELALIDAADIREGEA